MREERARCRDAAIEVLPLGPRPRHLLLLSHDFVFLRLGLGSGRDRRGGSHRQQGAARPVQPRVAAPVRELHPATFGPGGTAGDDGARAQHACDGRLAGRVRAAAHARRVHDSVLLRPAVAVAVNLAAGRGIVQHILAGLRHELADARVEDGSRRRRARGVHRLDNDHRRRLHLLLLVGQQRHLRVPHGVHGPPAHLRQHAPPRRDSLLCTCRRRHQLAARLAADD
mmetsp:Transcript_41029/g.132439  ORF Transcript_41029/g.132439 Transcript_41029/m.132439 type:complete len:226 (-) Transcript_41029:49-726(-)